MNKELFIEITDENQLDEILEMSDNEITGIFKHSTRCPISQIILRQFEKQVLNKENTKFYYLDLLSYRSISKEIAGRFDIEHQSPQLILLHNKKVISYASHNQILDINFDGFIK